MTSAIDGSAPAAWSFFVGAGTAAGGPQLPPRRRAGAAPRRRAGLLGRARDRAVPRVRGRLGQRSSGRSPSPSRPLLVVVAVATGRGWRSAWWSRRAEVAEGLCGAAALASVFVAVGCSAGLGADVHRREMTDFNQPFSGEDVYGPRGRVMPGVSDVWTRSHFRAHRSELNIQQDLERRLDAAGEREGAGACQQQRWDRVKAH